MKGAGIMVLAFFQSRDLALHRWLSSSEDGITLTVSYRRTKSVGQLELVRLERQKRPENPSVCMITAESNACQNTSTSCTAY
jgi:hypothetical protein